LLSDFYRTEDYLSAGIRIIELSPDEILAVVKEGWARITGVWPASATDEVKQKEFHEAISRGPGKKYHAKIHKNARLSAEWLALHNQGKNRFGTTASK